MKGKVWGMNIQERGNFHSNPVKELWWQPPLKSHGAPKSGYFIVKMVWFDFEL